MNQKLEWVFITEQEVTAPSKNGLYMLRKDNFWIYHPQKGFLFWKNGVSYSPQCNRDERTITILLHNQIKVLEDKNDTEKLALFRECVIRHAPTAFVPSSPSEWRE